MVGCEWGEGRGSAWAELACAAWASARSVLGLLGALASRPGGLGVGKRPLRASWATACERARWGKRWSAGPRGGGGGAAAGLGALLRCGWAAGREAPSWAGMAAAEAGPARGKGGGEVGRLRAGLRGEMSGGGRLRPKEGGSRVGFFLFNFFLFSLLPTT